jgi:hypothetical protein
VSQIEVERCLGRLITDAGFRASAACSLQAACYSEGFVLSTEEAKFLGGIDLSQFGPVAEILDDALRRT